MQTVAKLRCLIVGPAASENFTEVIPVTPFAYLEHCPGWILLPASHATKQYV